MSGRRGRPQGNINAEEAMCEFLGIAPIGISLSAKDVAAGWELLGPPKYPPVSSTWEGFGMLVERLDEVDLVWTKDIVLNTENMQEEHVVYLRNSVGQHKDLPRALALAVADLAGRQG